MHMTLNCRFCQPLL